MCRAKGQKRVCWKGKNNKNDIEVGQRMYTLLYIMVWHCILWYSVVYYVYVQLLDPGYIKLQH